MVRDARDAGEALELILRHDRHCQYPVDRLFWEQDSLFFLLFLLGCHGLPWWAGIKNYRPYAGSMEPLQYTVYRGKPERFRSNQKYISPLDYFTIWSTWLLKVRLLSIITPSNLVFSTLETGWLFIAKVSKVASLSCWLKVLGLHFTYLQ